MAPLTKLFPALAAATGLPSEERLLSDFADGWTRAPDESDVSHVVTAIGPGAAECARPLVERLRGAGVTSRALSFFAGERSLPGGSELNAVQLLLVSPSTTEALREAAGTFPGVDVCVERNHPLRAHRRLVCMDVDSTFCEGEFIDELAEHAGAKEQVAAVTARAMRGELDFEAALRQRVALLAGVTLEAVQRVSDHTRVAPGGAELVQTLRSYGIRVGVVSGGFSQFVDQLRAQHQLDFGVANELEVVDGRLTGRVLGAVVDAPKKAAVLREQAALAGCALAQTVAIGDGANDLEMVRLAGLGIAYHGKPKLRVEADHVVSATTRLDSVLHLVLGLGVTTPVRA